MSSEKIYRANVPVKLDVKVRIRVGTGGSGLKAFKLVAQQADAIIKSRTVVLMLSLEVMFSRLKSRIRLFSLIDRTCQTQRRRVSM
jgi:hypothetical protein